MNNQQLKSKEDRRALQEWVAVQSGFKNDVVLLGMILGVEMAPTLESREEDGALIPSFKLKIVTRETADKIAEQKKIYLERRKQLLAQVGDTNPDVKLVDEIVKQKPEPKGDEESKKLFWEIYLELEKQYEAGFVPTLIGEKQGIFPSYEIVPKPNEEEKVVPTPESVDTAEK